MCDEGLPATCKSAKPGQCPAAPALAACPPSLPEGPSRACSGPAQGVHFSLCLAAGLQLLVCATSCAQTWPSRQAPPRLSSLCPAAPALAAFPLSLPEGPPRACSGPAQGLVLSACCVSQCFLFLTVHEAVPRAFAFQAGTSTPARPVSRSSWASLLSSFSARGSSQGLLRSCTQGLHFQAMRKAGNKLRQEKCARQLLGLRPVLLICQRALSRPSLAVTSHQQEQHPGNGLHLIALRLVAQLLPLLGQRTLRHGSQNQAHARVSAS